MKRENVDASFGDGLAELAKCSRSVFQTDCEFLSGGHGRNLLTMYLGDGLSGACKIQRWLESCSCEAGTSRRRVLGRVPKTLLCGGEKTSSIGCLFATTYGRVADGVFGGRMRQPVDRSLALLLTARRSSPTIAPVCAAWQSSRHPRLRAACPTSSPSPALRPVPTAPGLESTPARTPRSTRRCRIQGGRSEWPRPLPHAN